MTIEESMFARVKTDPEKMRQAGFRKNPDTGESVFETDFAGGEFHAVLRVDRTGKISGKVIEKETGEEYLPLRTLYAGGEFAYRIREEYETLLRNLASEIGTPQPFSGPQANRLAEAVREKYGDSPQFPWKDEEQTSGAAEYGVFRHRENGKWYAAVLYTEASSLMTQEEKQQKKERELEEKKKREEERRKREEARKAGKKVPPLQRKKKEKEQEAKKINILNVKIRPQEREALWKEKGIYPAWHMNSRSWISIPLDDSVSDEKILELLAESWALTGAGGHKRSPEEKKTWLIPSNPKMFDIAWAFGKTQDAVWKQGKGIQTGDIVYMYVAIPYQAILYKCTVTKAHSGFEDDLELMDIHIDERYDEKLCTLDLMKQFHVTCVRGPRFMPEDLEQYIQEHNTMRIRHAAPVDLPVIMEIYAGARKFMAEHGNPRQWGARGWPPEELIRKDMERQKSYVCTVEGRVCGVFYYDFGENPEPGYRDITEGAWKDASPYGVIHRLASDGSEKGTGKFCIRWAFSQCGHLRVDTHPDNTVMQNLLAELGFEKRGIIHVQEDDDPRIAYEKG